MSNSRWAGAAALAVWGAVGIAIALAPDVGAAQRPASAAGTPTTDQILAKYEEALGGRDALAKINTRIVRSRRFQDIGPPEDHDLLRYSKKPPSDSVRVMSIMSHTALDGTFLRWTNGCDAKTGWNWSGRTDPSGKVRDDPATTGGLCEQNLYFYGYFPLDLARMKRNYQRFELKSTQKIFQPPAGPTGEAAGGQGADIVPSGGARETYLMLGVPRPGDSWDWLYFDVQTGFLLRYADAGTGPAPVPAGNTERIVDYLQYRNVGNGTKSTFQFVTQTPTTRVRGVHMSVEDNTPIDNKVFIKPQNSLRADKGLP